MKTFLLSIILATFISSGIVGQNLPIADFTCDTVSTTPYCCINFMDLSSNSPIGWIWEFGDGVTSIIQNPSHCFPAPGAYNVTLVVSNSSGTDTISKVIVTTICDCPSVVGLDEVNTISSVIANPNPFSEIAIIVSEFELRNATLLVYNSIGTRVEIINGIFGKEFVLNRTNLTNGIYFALLKQGNIVVSINKLIVIGN